MSDPEFRPSGSKRHRLQKGRRLNVPLLAGSLAVVAVVAFLGFFWHRHQTARIYDALKDRAETLGSEEDWAKSANYWQRYLWLEPDDFAAQLKLVEAREQLVKTPRERAFFSLLLHQTIGAAPESDQATILDLKVRVAKNYLEMGDNANAYGEAFKLLDLASETPVPPPEPHGKALRRVLAMSGAVLARPDAKVDERFGKDPLKRRQGVQFAADDLLAALAESPGDSKLAVMGASFFRLYKDHIAGGPAAAEARADKIIDDLVAAAPEDPAALVTRYEYRYRWPRAGEKPGEADLEAALKLDPNQYSALLYSANSLLESDPAAAREKLALAIKQTPTDHRAYQLLAQIQLQANEPDEAISTLEKARTAVGPENQVIGTLLTQQLIRAGKVGPAREALAELESAVELQLAGLTVEGRKVMQDRMHILRAQLEVASGNLTQAVDALRSVVSTAGDGPEAKATRESLEAKRILAALMERLGQWDMAAQYWMEASAPPQSAQGATKGAELNALREAVADAGDATRRAAMALMATGRFDQAIQQFDRYLHPPTGPTGGPGWEPEPDTWVYLAQAHLQKQLNLREEARSWSEFDSALATARRLNPQSWQLFILEFERHASQSGGTATPQAKDVLALGETKFKDTVEFWRAAALSYQRIGLQADAERAMDRFDELEPNLAHRAMLRASIAARNSDYAGADAALVAAIGKTAQESKLALQCMQVEVLLSSGDTEGAMEAASQLVDDAPMNRRAVTVALEVALRAKRFPTAEKWEQLLRKLDPTDEFTPRIYEVRRLLEQYDKLTSGERTSLAQRIGELRDRRPDWGDLLAISARLTDLQGNRRQAIEGYQRAIAQGVASPAIVERLVTLLYAEGRPDEADAYFARLSSGRSSSSARNALEIAGALHRDNLDEAVKLANQGVDENPDDPVRRIWLARLLVENEKPEEAQDTLRKARSQFPNDTRVFSALFLMLQRAGQLDQARELLEEFVSQPSSGAEERHRIAAQAFQMLNDNERALAEAEAAVRFQPESVPSRMLLARLLTAIDIARATEEFRKVLELDPTQGEARRNLALLLAMSGDQADWARAVALLDNPDTAGATSDGLADNRVRAALLSHQGRNRAARIENLAASRKIMLEQIQTRGAATPDLDRLFLARLYEQEATLSGDVALVQAAREQFRLLVDREAAPVSNVREYANFLVRQLGTEDVSEDQRQQWESLRTLLHDDAVSHAEECGRRLAAHTLDPEQPVTMVEAVQLAGSQAGLLHAIQQNEPAIAAIAKFEAEKLPVLEANIGQQRAWSAVAGLYSLIGQSDKSEAWYRKLSEVAPETFAMLARELASQGRHADAVDACLAALPTSAGAGPGVAIVLAQVLSGAPDDAASMARGEPVIAKALAAYGDNVDLLLASAVFNVARKNDAEAIRLFERVVELAPKNALALNNLATLLAEQPGKLAAAQGLVKRAMDENGRQPPFLDTLGTIQIRAGQAAQAIASLEEAVANGGVDARYYFHLAAAYQLGKQPDEARKAFDRAMELGLDKQILTQGDQALLEDLKKELTPSATPRLDSKVRRAASDRSHALVLHGLATAA